MNKNIDLTKILKDCPKGTKFYTTVWGEVYFEKIVDIEVYTIEIDTASGYQHLTKEGYYIKSDDAECIIFPSKEQRNWSNFSAPWYKNDKFDPKTLQPFDRILGRLSEHCKWTCGFFSYADDNNFKDTVNCMDHYITNVIPYNEETKHLVGTKEEAPEFYRYWEN